MTRRNLETRLQRLVGRQLARSRVRNIVVGIESADSRIKIAAAAGHADAGGKVAMTVDTPYHLASITKMH